MWYENNIFIFFNSFILTTRRKIREHYFALKHNGLNIPIAILGHIMRYFHLYMTICFRKINAELTIVKHDFRYPIDRGTLFPPVTM